MSVALTPSKRQYDRSVKEANGRGKWQKSAGRSQLATWSPNSVVFRLLCPASKTGSIIGKGGAIISQIRQETGVKVKVEETVPGCDERVVIITGSEKETEFNAEQSKDNESEAANATNDSDATKAAKKVNANEEADAAEESNATEEANETRESSATEEANETRETNTTEMAEPTGEPKTTEEASTTKEGEDVKEHDKNEENGEDKRSNNVEGSKTVKENVAVQKALLLVFERIVEAELETDGVNNETSKSRAFVLRLLVLSNQVGRLLGKGGSVIKQMSAESRAQIRVLPRDKLPLCASGSDELVQIAGEVDGVRKALQSVSQQLLENAARDNDFPANPTFSHQYPKPEVHPPHHSFSSRGAAFASGHRDVSDFHPSIPPLVPKFHESGLHGRMKLPHEILTFRLLCPEERVGGIIGKGGTVVKSIQQETGCEIKVVDDGSDSEDRIIAISGPVHPEDRISAAQDAVLRVQTRIARAVPDNKENTITARLLVPSNQIGCLLGKGGGIIAEMRKSSGAYIRILGKDQIPKYALEGEEVVQINGDHEAVEEALLQITARLQHHFFREAFPSINHPPNPPFLGQVPPFGPYVGRREFSPPGMYSNFGPSFHGGLPRHGGFHPHDERPPFMHDFRRQGMAPLMSERKPWGSQGLMEDGGPLGFPEFTGAPQRRIPGFTGGKPAIITSTTVEAMVPSSLVPIIYGEDGFCLKQIRQISDAKITITDPKPGAHETVIVISGTPEQTHAAQSLIQAFVMSETESA